MKFDFDFGDLGLIFFFIRRLIFIRFVLKRVVFCRCFLVWVGLGVWFLRGVVKVLV